VGQGSQGNSRDGYRTRPPACHLWRPDIHSICGKCGFGSSPRRSPELAIISVGRPWLIMMNFTTSMGELVTLSAELVADTIRWCLRPLTFSEMWLSIQSPCPWLYYDLRFYWPIRSIPPPPFADGPLSQVSMHVLFCLFFTGLLQVARYSSFTFCSEWLLKTRSVKGWWVLAFCDHIRRRLLYHYLASIRECLTSREFWMLETTSRLTQMNLHETKACTKKCKGTMLWI
jgi:hypothetical protein